jgi:hypothetical protein
LSEFQPATEAAIPIFRLYRKHLGVQVGATVANSRERTGKADHSAAVEGGNHLSPDALGDNQHSERHQVGVTEAPDLLLQPDAGPQLLESLTPPDLEGWVRMVRAGAIL